MICAKATGRHRRFREVRSNSDLPAHPMTQTRPEGNLRSQFRPSPSISDAPGVKECKEPCTRAIAFARTALAGALDVGILLTRCKATWIAHTISRDELTRMRYPLGARVPSELHKCSARHHIVGELASRVARFVHESWLPMVVGTQAHLNTPPPSCPTLTLTCRRKPKRRRSVGCSPSLPSGCSALSYQASPPPANI